jgi:hypothetical protein
MEVKSRKDFSWIFWIHLLLIIVSYSSFLYLDWIIILIGVISLQIYYLLRGGCDLTFKEFGDDKDTTFAWYYLSKIIPRLDKLKTKLFIRHVLPMVLLFAAILLQTTFSFKPLVDL